MHRCNSMPHPVLRINVAYMACHESMRDENIQNEVIIHCLLVSLNRQTERGQLLHMTHNMLHSNDIKTTTVYRIVERRS